MRTYRRRRDAKLQLRHVRAAWQLYEAGWSLRRLGRELWERFGFASPHSCDVALHNAFLSHGYKLRDRLAASVAASTRHGLAPRGERPPEWNELRRRRRRARGEVRGVACAGEVRVAGGVRRCLRPTLAGRTWCVAHDPDRADERAAILAVARAIARG